MTLGKVQRVLRVWDLRGLWGLELSSLWVEDVIYHFNFRRLKVKVS